MGMAQMKSGLSVLGPAYLVGAGHGATHWIAAIFYFLLPFLAKDLGISYAQAGALAAVFQMASFCANVVSGPVVDITGRRVLWQVISLVIGAAALFCVGISQYYWAAVLALIAIGASNNLWHPAAISYLSARFPERRGLALSIHALGANMGDAVAPLVMGPVVLLIGWRGVAQTSVLVPILVALGLFLFLRRTGRASNEAHQPLSIGAYFGGVAGMLRNRAVLALCLMSSFRNMAQAGLLVFLPLYLADEMGLSPAVMGVVLFAFQGAGILAAPLAGHWSDKAGRRPVVMAGITTTTLVLIGLTFVSNSVVYVAGVSVLGFALFAIRPVVHSWLMDLTPENMGGSATSLMFGLQALFAMIAPVLGGWLADRYGLPSAFYLLSVAMILANAVVILLPKAQREAGDGDQSSTKSASL
ncbi:MFS transporter [Aestuariispira ectoiniformans]|uniref:MFS transporter n=1 Tax=Aestuariispira ectoiniformans TaxID=2775080 RepID=UPI00223B80A6|nr:MFS transporter [Aestuariispira ectoiniformans]